MNCRSIAFLSLTALVCTSLCQAAPDRQSDVRQLKRDAAQVSRQIGRLAATGNLPTDDEGIKQLRKLVDQLAEINERLKALEGKTPSAPAAQVTKITSSGYILSQYQKTDRLGAANSAFRFQDIRLNLDFQTDPRVNGRISFDLAQTTAQNQAQLRDAWFNYVLSPKWTATFGQQVLPLGYQNVQSSFDRFFADRNRIDSALFPGERSRGVTTTTNLSKSTTMKLGLVDALTNNDPEQLAQSPGTADKLNGLVSIQHKRGDDTLRATVLAGERGKYSSVVGGVPTTSPQTMRQYLVVDWQRLHLFDPKLTLFFEGMAGRDRVGNDVAAATRVDHPLWAFDAVVTYDLTTQHQFVARVQEFDPNRDAAGDSYRSIGAGYIYRLSPMTKFHLLHEIFVDQSRAGVGQTRYSLTTLRFATKF